MLLSQSQFNLHTHSFYCKHGNGTIADYVAQAKKDGLKVLGFSEHCPLPDREYQKGNRMDYEDLPFYEADVKEAKKDKEISTFLGAECDWLDDEFAFYRDELLGKRGYDYLCCSVHHIFDPGSGRERFLGFFSDLKVSDVADYVKWYTDALRSGIFLFGCHPDLIFNGYRRWDKTSESASRDIIQCAKECNIPLEINDNGLRKKPIQAEDGMRQPYPVRQFWEMAKDMGVKIITNSDAHRPIDVTAHLRNSASFAEKLGIRFAKLELEDGKILGFRA